MKSKDHWSRKSMRLGQGGLALAAAALISLGSPAHATDYDEGPVIGNSGHPDTDTPYEVNDLSSTGKPTSDNPPMGGPTYIGALTLGSNFVTGATIPYGTPADPMTGERPYQDPDYFSFTVPNGAVLSHLYLVAPSASGAGGTTITSGDQLFAAISYGRTVDVTLPSTSGLLGYTLISSSQIGTDVLPALGASNPINFTGGPFAGVTRFDGALPAGDYSIWLLDGDRPVNYKLDLQVAAAPEPATWAMMLIGVGGAGLFLRRSRRAGVAREGAAVAA